LKFFIILKEKEISKGDVSQEYYSEWMETQNQKLLDDIESYNKQDCLIYIPTYINGY
jgi:predicted RecB family nuclease